ncbi:MAG TPA: DUF1592 domain-containing protein, partial [Pirellulaceae bacterium]|nr:DUF1592 domain-containing protein [Pirellulaceae bacterium]
EGGLELKTLGTDLDDQALFAKWERIHDRVLAGEMPPALADVPPPADRAAFLKSLAEPLAAAHMRRKATVLRRLNRREYENTLNDLFGTNLKLAELLPEDGRSHEFDNVGEALGISLVQMQRYMESAEAVLDAAIARTVEPPPSKVVRASYADTRGAEQWLNKIWLHRDDGAVVFFKQYGYPSGMLREANVQREGWYTVRVTGYAFQSDEPITFSVGGTTFARGLEQPTFGYFSLPPGEPTTIELRAWISRNYMIDITPYGISDNNNEIRQKGVQGYDGPGLAIQHVEIEGPLVDEFPSRGHKLIFDGLNRREVPPRNPADRRRPNYVAKFEIAADDPAAAAAPVLARVAERAFRRPVPPERLAPYQTLFEAELKQGASFESALRTAIAALFCSPEFLYLRELPHARGGDSAAGSYWLDDYSLASRLAYFLTRTAPDDELLAAAASGKLSTDRDLLLAQAERLLADPRSARFVRDFTDAWLNLRDIEFTNPDAQLFPEFDPFLQWSMVAETRTYFRKLIDDNLPVTSVVKSDFAILNSRLAEHYGIPGVSGPELRPVKLPAESVRGGFLSQGSVLKVSANGSNTSPVVRGVYVAERILGQAPPPPPPGVPGVEPDIRGATTLRELLDKHRSLDSCKACHQMIDPPGFALESFDPVGGWRDRFRSLGDGERVDLQIRGQRVRYRLGPPVDASGELSGGKEFAGYREFRDLLAAEQQVLARTLATKLLTFATGRELGFSDRAEIERIVSQSAESGHGVKDLIRLAIASEIFRRK